MLSPVPNSRVADPYWSMGHLSPGRTAKLTLLCVIYYMKLRHFILKNDQILFRTSAYGSLWMHNYYYIDRKKPTVLLLAMSHFITFILKASP